jgi:hypothetical protein
VSAKKRGLKSTRNPKVSAQPKKNQRSQEKPLPSAEADDTVTSPRDHDPVPQARVFGPTRLTAFSDTPNLNRWFKERDNLRVIERVDRPKVEVHTLTPSEQIPDRPNRAFRVSSDECVDLEITWDPLRETITSP